MRNFTFIKNIKGGLSFSLQSYDMMLPERTFTIPYNVDKIAIPEQYAIGLFISEGALRMYNKGYFTVEHVEDLEKAASMVGFFAEKVEVEVMKKEDIEKCLKDHNVKKVEEILERNDYVEVSNLMVLVRENIENLPKNIIDKIGNACGVDLEVE